MGDYLYPKEFTKELFGESKYFSKPIKEIEVGK